MCVGGGSLEQILDLPLQMNAFLHLSPPTGNGDALTSHLSSQLSSIHPVPQASGMNSIS